MSSIQQPPIKIGVLGGSGLYDLEGLTDLEEIQLSTPYGEPSDAFLTGQLDGIDVVFLPRHGRGHRVNPSEINFRANIWGLKRLGVTHVLSVSAVGSLREEIVPGHFVVIDQFIDRTRHRPDTFFEDGIVAHVMFADPVCSSLRAALLEACAEVDLTVHDGGTYVNMEGPQFSTRAESNLYRSWGADVIGMTNLQEAKLAREAELHYATLAMSTDYDCWHTGHDDVTVDTVIATMNENVGHARELIARTIRLIPGATFGCGCDSALAPAIMTARECITPEARLRLGPLVDKYLAD